MGRTKTIQRKGSTQIANHAQEILDTGHNLMEMTAKERDVVETLVNPSKPKPLDLATVVENVVERLRSTHPEAVITVSGTIAFRVRAVPELPKALEELIENGIVHTEADQPRVSVQIDQSGTNVIIRITDNGKGIPPEEIALISDNQTETQLRHGSGLGLKLADLVIRQSGGSLEFSNTRQGGTQVLVRLQLVE